MANRVCFLVDGFNVYHSVCEALRTRKGASMKWLDMQDLCASYLSSIGNGAILEKVFYFSAFMDWIPDKVARHQRAPGKGRLRREGSLMRLSGWTCGTGHLHRVAFRSGAPCRAPTLQSIPGTKRVATVKPPSGR